MFLFFFLQVADVVCSGWAVNEVACNELVLNGGCMMLVAGFS